MKTGKNQRYILVTPARNEASFIPDLIASVKNQSIKPILWVIVDDGSTDKTPEILDAKTTEIGWMEVIHLPPGERKRGQHYAYVCKQGFDYALSKVKDWDFIGLVDADMVLEEEYFERLIEKFQEIDRLGIASGGIYHQGELQKRRQGHAIGGCRLFRRECFRDVGGYQVYPGEFAGADTIANTKAKIKGWKLQHFPDIKANHRRPTLGVEGAWQGGLLRAHAMYYFDYHPLLMVGAFLNLLCTRPYYHALSFAVGYIRALVSRKERIPDEEIRRFFKRGKWQEVKQDIWIYFGN